MQVAFYDTNASGKLITVYSIGTWIKICYIILPLDLGKNIIIWSTDAISWTLELYLSLEPIVDELVHQAGKPAAWRFGRGGDAAAARVAGLPASEVDPWAAGALTPSPSAGTAGEPSTLADPATLGTRGPVTRRELELGFLLNWFMFAQIWDRLGVDDARAWD